MRQKIQIYHDYNFLKTIDIIFTLFTIKKIMENGRYNIENNKNNCKN